MSERRPSLRPGLSSGGYPQATPARLSALDRRMRAWSGVRRRRRAAREMARVPEQVGRYAKLLENASDSDLAAGIGTLRARLGLEGFAARLVIEAFACIREIAGRKLGTPHYDVQLMGGWLMTQGLLAEMQTGEGKTLTATLPACTAALAGIPVHVVSSNDYLVARDCESMRPVYEALGLTVAAVTEEQKEPEFRRHAYGCDVVYATGKTLAFDYLRDRIAGASRRTLAAQVGAPGGATPESSALLRGLCFAVIDEADSVLIDEASTPLILSQQSGDSGEEKVYKRALRLARSLEEERDFALDRKRMQVALKDRGRVRLAELAEPIGGLWAGPRRREEWTVRALSALYLYERDRQYIVREDSVQIVDPLTGRVSPDRSWEGGLHQLIELKEGCSLTPQNETLARISTQQFFRRYLRLSGMTGTASEVASELAGTYGLDPVVVPTRKPSRRSDLGLRLHATAAAKIRDVIERVQRLHAIGRPVLIGTCSVEASHALSARLEAAGILHRVLNAYQDAEEAALVAEAGSPGAVTVATSMAGRGTDIKLVESVEALGGLHVIATERSEASRVDRQLFGRCGRQGEAGSHEVVASLEDDRVCLHGAKTLRRLASLSARMHRGSRVPKCLALALLSSAQKAEEQRDRRARAALELLDEQLDRQLSFVGRQD